MSCDILLLSVSAGAGHVRAAEALRETAAIRYPGLQVQHLDVMEVVPRLFKRLYADSYLQVINRHPAFWGYLYHASDRSKPDSTLTRLREALERLNTRALVKKQRTWFRTQLPPHRVLAAESLRDEGELFLAPAR
jgi:processive 1,2-diacylglycerol beta-glucosyltransferase